MKTPIQPSHEQGSALIITLTLGVILMLGMASYILLFSTQKTLVTRSQTWNSALDMAEAGVEEAMAQINSSPSDFSANNWTNNGNTYGPVTRTLNGNSYSVSIVGSSPPTIYSTGYVTVPITGAKISRAVRLITTTSASSQSVFNVAFAAINSIQFNGNGVATDSWNSHTNSLSTNGQYDSTKTSTNGNVASVQGLVDIGNHTINGNLYLGPTATYNGGGTVTGKTYTDFNVNFPNVTLPTNTWTMAGPTTITTTTLDKHGNPTTTTTTAYDFSTPGNYTVPSDAYPIVVESGVKVTLNVTSSTFNPSSLMIHGGTTNSGTALVYLNGPTSASIAGNTAVDASNRPENLQYFGMSSLTSLTFSGTSSFVGVIYAPEVSLTLNGGGNNIGVVGSVIVNNITMNGHYNFHYDESLVQSNTNSPSRGFIATSWQEL